jgi:phosphate/sulfate permease
VARNVVWAWVLTIPCTGLIAAAIYFLVAAV